MPKTTVTACILAFTEAMASLKKVGSYHKAVATLTQALFLWGLDEVRTSPLDLVPLGGPFIRPAWRGMTPSAISNLWTRLETIRPTASELGLALATLHLNHKTSTKRNTGIHYTPPPLTRFMTQLGLALYEQNLPSSSGPNPYLLGELRSSSFRLYDPAAGTGAFLVTALDTLASLVGPKAKTGELLPFLAGQDIDADAIYITKARLWLQMLPEIKQNAAPFPPLANITVGDSLKEPLLRADLVLANPPYQRQECIRAQTKEFLVERFRGKLPRQADLYSYFLINLDNILKPGGVAVVITPVAWLEVDYGRAIQDFLQQRLEIPLIASSATERWFQAPAVHTAICTFLRRHSSLKPKDPTALVNLQAPLSKVPPKKLAALTGMTAGFKQAKNWRVVTLPRCRLRALTHKREPVRATWGSMLRAPAAFFTLHQCSPGAWTRAGKLGQVRRGFTSGANAFFFVRDVTGTGSKAAQRQLGAAGGDDLAIIAVKTRQGEHYFWVERELLFPLIKSPREVEGYLVDESRLNWKVLLLPPDKDYIETLQVAAYIRWGEKQGFQHRPTLKSRPLWWSLPKLLPPQVLARQFYDQRFNFPYNPEAILCDHTFYYLTGCKDPELVAALLNSSLNLFHVELWGRSNMGDGVLTFYGLELADLPVVDPALFNLGQQWALKKCFRRLTKRAVLPISQEVKQSDRQELDLLVLSALGLTGDSALALLEKIYADLSQLVSQRRQRSRPGL